MQSFVLNSSYLSAVEESLEGKHDGWYWRVPDLDQADKFGICTLGQPLLVRGPKILPLSGLEDSLSTLERTSRARIWRRSRLGPQDINWSDRLL